ncbi:hypothetical protein PV327_000163 [Microctonus hyperodae]|uniref:BZIP domain-containing protein n=1 Tax=Microctonus hyperodae TaxID=165561 RepID=A0AA39L1P4_MICHY|nr:hypothetical protein PV327_000163 [Microctonus hyperodae]
MSSQEMFLWKAEPVSPSGNSIGDADDWFYINDNSSPLTKHCIDPEYDDINSSRAQIASKLLEQLDQWVKEEPLSDWLEEKVESLFDEIPSPECGQNKPNIPSIINNNNVKQQPPSTQLLLQEFETILGDVEACHQFYPTNNNSTTLTPPQSPSSSTTTEQLPIDTQLLVTLQPVVDDVQQFVYEQPGVNVNVSIVKSDSYLGQICGGWNAENVSLLPLAGDVASELAAVDEYVRSCAEDLSPSSPVTSSGASCSSFEDSADDPDWTIGTSTSHSKSSSRSSSPNRSNKNDNNKQRNQRLTKNRHKPYSRPSIEDKKVRKKEQNKNAATRYRQKKKLEVTEIIGEEQELINYNDKLHNQVKDLKREIGYLKGLMRDLFKAKGLIN